MASKNEVKPRSTFTYEVLDALLQFKTTKRFCADYMGCHEKTIDNRLRKDHDMTFTEYHELKMDRTAYKLQQKAIDMALQGNTTMMIFSLKNIAKWQDKIETTHDLTEKAAKLVINV